MSIVATCSCGRGLSPQDDWIGPSATCPACGAEVAIPVDGSRSSTAWACLAFGLLALASFGADHLDLSKRLMPRTIARYVEEARSGELLQASMAAGFAGLVAGWMCRKTSFRRHSIGLILCTSCLALVFGQSLLTMWTSRQAVRRVMCVNNLKQIGLALANYEGVYGAYPPRVSRDPRGRPLLSWRVALLPYLEQGELYAKFHLDEAWDGPHNRALIDQIPYVYACPGQAAWCVKRTLYQVLDGPGMFLDPAKPTTAGEIPDGPDRTLAVVEGDRPVAWTGPGDIDPRTARPIPGREATHPGGFNALFVDGSVRFLKDTIAARIWDALGTRAGREVVQADAY